MKTLLNDSDTVLLVTNSEFVDKIDSIKADLTAIAEDRYILTDYAGQKGYRDYHDLKAAAGDDEPEDRGINDDDPFNIMYSSGTTGLPKGIVHTHYVRSWYGATFAATYRMTPESITMHAGAIVFDRQQDMITLLLGRQYHGARTGFAGGLPLLRTLDSVIHGVAHQVGQLGQQRGDVPARQVLSRERQELARQAVGQLLVGDAGAIPLTRIRPSTRSRGAACCRTACPTLCWPVACWTPTRPTTKSFSAFARMQTT